MPLIMIRVSSADIAAARRIALKMYPHVPLAGDAQAVISTAANLGLDRMRVIWNDAEDQTNAYSQAAIKRDQLHANEGRADQDTTTDGVPMREGE